MRTTSIVPKEETRILTKDELKRLADFFSLLIEIDKKQKKKGIVNDNN